MTPSARSPANRRWRGRLLHRTDEALMYFKGQGPLPEALQRLHQRLLDAGIPHVFVGGMAANAHGYRRTTEDIDVCMRAADLEKFRREMVGQGYQPVAGRTRRFFDASSQVTIDILVSGELAGNTRKQRDVKFPDPDEAVEIDGLPVVSLSRLVEMKLVTWRFKDWADVVELIRVHNLSEDFGDQFNPLVRTAYLQCFDQRIEEDRYQPDS
jgi:hypothetical protein